jgi:hypothetical protein
MKIIVGQPTGSTQSINVNEDDTIKELKNKISQKLGIDMKQHNLNHGTLVLDEQTDGKTLRDLGLEEEGMIHITSIFKGGF